MKFENIKYVYLIGIGGIGMSGLARYFNSMGKQVSGYDKTKTALTDELVAEGIAIHFDDDLKLIPREILTGKTESLIIYTPAVPPDHSELNYFRKNDYAVKKRAEVLGLITEQTFTIAVAGTHGKTTTSSLIAHLIKSSDADCTAFLGGITQNYGTNFILGSDVKKLSGKRTKIKPITVVEADEYDRSFLTLQPDIAVITSIDADHLDIYGDKKQMEESYAMFSNKVKKGGVLIIKKGADKVLAIETETKKVVTYSLRSDSEYYARRISVKKGDYLFDVVTPHQTLRGLTLGIPGKHNIENAVAAIAVAQHMNIFTGNIKNALATFKGVKRRFEYHVKTDGMVYIDDYAHHPEELHACISAVKEIYPGKKVTGVFQPHLYTRTRDFADGFARSLELLDDLILMDIYPAREKPIEGVTSQMLLDKIRLKEKMICSKKELMVELKRRNPEVLLTLGAGDIDTFIDSIKQEILNKLNNA